MKKFVLASCASLLLLVLLTGCDKKVEAPAVRTIGKPAPDFVLEDTSGASWRLSDLKGKVVFVNFWATWCPPCRAEMPLMQKLNQSLPGDRFQMLTILSNDKPEMGKKFVQYIGFTAPVLLDPENKAYKSYGLTGVPETYIVDKNGILREAIIGPMRWDSPEARKMLAPYLNE
jgi:cytochrome c biogenesis protein CcmG/thiol:disulfide interchange protein DsbE